MVAWPALDRTVAAAARSRAVEVGEAACFSCVDKAATGVCEGCGCFTCPACEAGWFGSTLCLRCLHSRREVRGDPGFRHRLVLYDNIALMLLVLPIIWLPFGGVLLAVLLSPVALFLVVRHRRAPRGLPPRGPLRLILAGAMAVLLMLGAATGIGALVYAVAGWSGPGSGAASEGVEEVYGDDDAWDPASGPEPEQPASAAGPASPEESR